LGNKIDGIIIKNISAGSLYSYNLGYREYWSSTNAVLDNSLFRMFLERNNLKVEKNRTKDIICLDFDFGFSEKEKIEELKEQKRQARKNNNKELIKNLNNQIGEIEKKNITKEQIRTEYYINGVTVKYVINKKDKCIKYKMLYRTPSKAKSGQCVFIKNKYYEDSIDWLTMGLYKKLPLNNAKIVEMSAYAPLVTSSIVDTVHIPIADILILEDQEINFLTKTIVVKSKEIGKKEIIDPVTNKISMKSIYECYVEHDQDKTEVTNTIWDGMGLIDEDICPDFIKGYALLRNHFFKMAGFKTKLKEFFKDYCEAKGLDYETLMIYDMFGLGHYVKEIKVITTNNAIKWLKFKELMGNTDKEAYQYWCKRINADGSIFGIVKTDHESKFSKIADVQQKSYQHLNTLPLPEGKETETIDNISQYSVDLINELKDDHNKFLEFLDVNKTFNNNYEMLIDLCNHNKYFQYCNYFLREKADILSEYKKKLEKGKILNIGDNLTVCGNPYALLLYATGQDWENDPTLKQEDGAIQCYTNRFEHDEYLCAFRNPHNSPNNILYLHNIYSKEIEKYFSFSKNIIAVNMIGSDAQDRANSMDEDSDFIYVTNQKDLVECARISYNEYPTIVNAIDMSGITYQNTPAAYAEMDNKFAKAGRAIGESSNLAQKAMSYYWTIKDEVTLDNVCILSILAQVAIDSVKREYNADVSQEIKRIDKLLDTKHNGLPKFWDTIKPIKKKKNEDSETLKKRRERRAESINYNLRCPMNILSGSLDRIKKADDPKYAIGIDKFFRKMDGRIDTRQIVKIEDEVKKYDKKIKAIKAKEVESKENESSQFEVERIEFDDILEVLKKIHLSEKTMNRIIDITFGISTKEHRNSKYQRKLLNLLYHMNKKKFLSNFCAIEEIEMTETPCK
jgi:hypothetical protein